MDDLETSGYGCTDGKPNGTCRGVLYTITTMFLACTVLALVIIFITAVYTPKPATDVNVSHNMAGVYQVCNAPVGLNLHKTAGDSGDISAMLPNGAELYLLNDIESIGGVDWYSALVLADGAPLTGWVSSGYLCK